MNYAARIKEAIENQVSHLAYLCSLTDASLQKKLDRIRQQMDIALTNQQTDAIELLQIWERQIIEARVMKHEQHPELNKQSEIESHLAETAAMEAELEKRQRALQKIAPVQIETPIEDIQEETVIAPQKPKPDQLKLF